jgi:NAD(P)-dependent dehydrogenase (short-subunit alcohol dehydrogenase family)
MEGKTLVVTGGASGLGKAVAHLFASRGANVAIISSPWPDDHNKDESYYTEREIEERYGKVVVSFCILLASLFGLISNKFVHREFSLLLIVRIASPCQPTSPMSTRWKQPSRELLTTLVRTFSPLHSAESRTTNSSSHCNHFFPFTASAFAYSLGRIDVLVNQAAVSSPSVFNFEDIDIDSVRSTFRNNVYSAFFTTKHCLRHMRRGGSIINSISVGAYVVSRIMPSSQPQCWGGFSAVFFFFLPPNFSLASRLLC